MKIDFCLILSAGFGSRLGEIGKILPKPLWPIFESTLLDLQYLYAKSLGIEKIYINVHHLKDELCEYIKNKYPNNEITVLYEDVLLDIGGGIHNLAANVDYTGNLLILNSDQFIFFEKKLLLESLSLLNTNEVVLFNYNTHSKFGYNALTIEDGLLTGIIKNSNLKNENIITYTGTSLINLSKLKPEPGISKFFESVANYQKKKIFCKTIEDIIYWDFGTIQRYVDSIRMIVKLYADDKDKFISFLKDNEVVDLKKLNKDSYNSNVSENYNFDKVSICEDDIRYNY